MTHFPTIYTHQTEAGWILEVPPPLFSAIPPEWAYLGPVPRSPAWRQWGIYPHQLGEVAQAGLATLCDPPLPLTQSLPEMVYDSPRAPFPHQRQGVAWLTPKHGALLADDQGLGKTQTTIDTIRWRRQQGQSGPILLVTKRSAIGVWQEEIRHNDPEATVSSYKRKDPYVPTTDWTLTTYDYLRRDYSPRTAAIAGGLKFPWHTVILDESHQVRNPFAQRTRAILRIRAQWKMLLTGTPMVNGFMDWWFPLFWLGVTKQGPQTFGAAFGTLNEWGEWEINPTRLPQLMKLITPIMLRRTKTDTLDLPPKIIETHWVRLTTAQAEAYRQAKEEARVQIGNKEWSAGNVLTRLLRFKQITGGLPLLGGDPLAHAKWDAFLDRYEDFLNAGHKIVLFTQFRSQWEFLMDHCAPWNPVGLHGEMSPRARTQAVQQFQNQPGTQVFVMTHAGREGITLTAAQTMVFFDLEWSPAWFDQASDRVHRIGQTGTVNIVRLLAKGTIDEKTLKVNLAEKSALQHILSESPLKFL